MSRWKHDMDDEDRANLEHLMRVAEVLETQAPQSVIDWNAALDAVPYQTPKMQRKKKREKKDG